MDVPVGQSEPVRGKDGGVPVDKDRLDTQQRGYLACVLPACATEARQSAPHTQSASTIVSSAMRNIHVLSRSITPRLRQRPNRPSHRLIRNLDKPIHDLIQPQVLPCLLIDRLPQFFECRTRGFDVEWLVLGGSEDVREVVWDEAPEEEVGVCYC